jgi:uncharacterized protein (DUF2126 family)
MHIMTVTVGLTHHTAYQYDKPISMSPHIFRLKPAAHCRTSIESYSLKITPENHFINWQQDAYGNYLARVVFPEQTKSFSFTVDLVAKMNVINPFDFFLEEYADNYPFKYDDATNHEVQTYLLKGEPNRLLLDFIEPVLPKKPLRTVDFLVAFNQYIANYVGYTIRMEPGVQSATETLTLKTGSCRDSAWLLVEAFRHIGLAARFVSGYLIQLSADEQSLDGPSGPAEDFTDLHAWCEVYVPGAGWIGLDPTSGLFAGEGHIPLACTPEPEAAAPVTGGIDKCEVTFDFYNKVTRINETPRVTKPYTQGQWAAIDDLGSKVDAALADENIKLTMGGEPTFISLDDMESEQWNTAADGADKRRLAHELFLKMKKEFAPAPLTHYAQGKWYPGEPLPRWQYGCYWRPDGEPLWHNQALLADINQTYQFDYTDAQAFMTHLLDRIQVPSECMHTAYEDYVYYMWQEGSLPIDAHPKDADMVDAMSREGFLARLGEGITQPTGFVLPLSFDDKRSCFVTNEWKFKRQRCYLIPGDSPLGYRLPLASLTIDAPMLERDPVAIPNTLSETPLQPGYSTKEMIKTALSIETRKGTLYIFMPPMSHLEHYLHLLKEIEATAEALNIPVVIEGYTPPNDPRLQKFAVTPDPGVIEVNVHPVTSWKDLKHNTTTLYGLAKATRLGTEKYCVDGRHTGTGGGNHVTLGGATVAESPFLLRPDVLRSFITFWQHHPGLSYLFSGQFIGPTSQAPRVDEARDELLYELEIAFAQMPEADAPNPWLVDRLLRNLLVDLTGNTHRAEFCIDKLYSPDSAAGRLGIVEFRGFEMPPHAQMSLMQNLLIRALLVSFWRQPYHKPLIRWGTQLHDKFMLPFYVQEDINQVCDYLKHSGFGIQPDWFTPFFEFRFPICGSRQIGDMTLELRNAIEPWHVLGEEASSTGTARYVDSSVERVEVRMNNVPHDRYIVTCNERRIPLHDTSIKGQQAAGIRFRAWQPPTALHPTIGVHAPLTFDVFDTWNNRSIGGFTYHVSHPGGRSEHDFPVNGHEAEGRRTARYTIDGHSAAQYVSQQRHSQAALSNYIEGAQRVEETSTPTSQTDTHVQLEPLMEPLNREYPYTLDLRRPASFYTK